MGDGSHSVCTEEVPPCFPSICAGWPRNSATPASISVESARDDERQTAGAGIQLLLQRMDRFEKHLSRLASRRHGIEELCKSMQELLQRVMTEQAKGRGIWYKKLLV